MRLALAPLLLATCALGCAANAKLATRASAPPLTAAPATDDDPPAFTPAPDGHAALAMSQGDSQARSLVRRFVRALLDADGVVLNELFAPTVLRLSAQQDVPRARIVAECQNTARQLRMSRDQKPEDRVRFDALELRSLPNGDIDVYLPLRGLDVPRAFANLPCISRVVVRPGQDARIVAVGN